MNDPAIEEKVREIAAGAAGGLGIEFVHLELIGERRNLTVRVYIDKHGGVTVEDCAAVSRRMEEKLDGDDLIPGAYVLEVSSPGLERGLYSIDDFRRFEGQKVKVKLASPVNGQNVHIGTIEGVNGGEILLSDNKAGEIRFSHKNVVKANLRVDLEKEFKKR